MSAHANSSNCTGPCQAPPQLQLYQSIIFATPVLFACLLLVLFLLLYMRKRREAYNATHSRAQFAINDFSPLDNEQEGLSISFRQKLPTVPFDASREDNQCAVCLGEYLINEKLQELPVCKHLFHISCIDEWLAKNDTCPMCRSSLVPEQPSNVMGLVERMEENRRWEERVVSRDGHDGSIHVRSREEYTTSSMVGVLEITLHLSGEHAINIERS